MAVAMAKGLQNKGANIKTFIMDNDTVTISKLKENVSHNIVKLSDQKGISNALYGLANEHKVLKKERLYKKFFICMCMPLIRIRGIQKVCAKGLVRLFHTSLGTMHSAQNGVITRMIQTPTNIVVYHTRNPCMMML